MRDPSVLGSALTSWGFRSSVAGAPLAAPATAQQPGAQMAERHDALRRAGEVLTSAVRASAPAAAREAATGPTSPAGPSRDLRPGDQDLALFLQSLTVTLAQALAYGGRTIWCSVTVLDARGDRTLASSSETAQALDALQHALADGPGLTAIRGDQLVHVGDSLTHPRWTSYLRVAAAQYGLRSVLAAPFTLLEAGPACLTIQCDRPHALDSAQIQAVRAFVLEASAAMNGVLHLHPRPAAS